MAQHLALYRKWRPRTFDEMCGQQHITSVLKKQCAQGRVSHAYLFCGTRGTGKTSAAKILAKAVNCENPQDGNPCNECFACRSIDNGSATDVLEIDAASNNKVENVRDLREEVVYPPSVLKKRVYIVDEVHMLTDSAFNALLKTLEEPPEYVVFILATTELSELPATIISRCMRFDFSRIDESAIFDRLMYVASAEGIQIEKEAAELISHLADGALRDALSLLEACTNGYNGVLDAKAVRDVLGLAGDEAVYSLLHAIAERNVPDAIAVIDTVHRSSKDISAFVDDIASAVSSIIIDKQLRKFGKNANLRGMLPKLSEEFTAEQLFLHCFCFGRNAGQNLKICDEQARDYRACGYSYVRQKPFGFPEGACCENIRTGTQACSAYRRRVPPRGGQHSGYSAGTCRGSTVANG